MKILIKNPNDPKNFEIWLDDKRVEGVSKYELEANSNPPTTTTLKLYIKTQRANELQLML